MKLAIEESVLRQALEALEGSHPRFGIHTDMWSKSVIALRTALDAAEKVEPVAWIHRHKAYPTKVDDLAPGYYGSAWSHEPLYTHPQDTDLRAAAQAVVDVYGHKWSDVIDRPRKALK